MPIESVFLIDQQNNKNELKLLDFKVWFILWCFVPTLSSGHEKVTVDLYFR